jgi:hypothetical protein
VKIQANYRHKTKPLKLEPFAPIRAEFRARKSKDKTADDQISFREYARETTFTDWDEALRFAQSRQPGTITAYFHSGSTSLWIYVYENGTATVLADASDTAECELLVRTCERELVLEPLSRTESATAGSPEPVIFLAYPFNEAGRRIAGPVKRFLEALGFEVLTGEEYAPLQVSNKVRDRVLRSAVLIGIVVAGTPSEWSIQEPAFALGSNKTWIPLVMEGVERPAGIAGDLEAITFGSDGNLTTAFLKLLEGLTHLGYTFSLTDDS